MQATRRAIRRLHLWLGLGLGGLMALAGLTGAALVFYVEIDRALHPEASASGSADPAAFDRALATLRARWPDKAGPWRFEVTEREGAIPARYYNPPETAGRHFAPMMVWLLPDGSTVLRRDFWGDHAMTWIYDLHYELQFGEAGKTVFGYAGLALLVLLLSGLWAWWPRGGWGKALRFKRSAAPVRRLYDLHKLTGLAGLPLLAMLTATGVMLALPRESEAVLAATLGPPDAAATGAGEGEGEGAPLTVSQAMATARHALPGARVAWVETPPASGEGAFRLRMRQAGDPSFRFPHSFVVVEARGGRVLSITDAARAGTTTTVLNWLHPLHDGSAGGLALRIAVLLAGLGGAMLFATGLWRWLARRRTGRASAPA